MAIDYVLVKSALRNLYTFWTCRKWQGVAVSMDLINTILPLGQILCFSIHEQLAERLPILPRTVYLGMDVDIINQQLDVESTPFSEQLLKTF